MTVDTIFAVSSGAPPAAIAILRISGPDALRVAGVLAKTLPSPRVASVRALRDPRGATLIDRALVLVFPAPRTATGEDIVELHVHGGRAVVAAVEGAIEWTGLARRAEAGEFTRRALTNGVIDLTAAEGLADLLSAQTETQRRAAVRMAEGGIRLAIEGWTDRLIVLAAAIEAQLDFSDSDDVAEDDLQAIRTQIAALAQELAAVVDQPTVERLHEGVRVVIAGPPNSGKSTLLNALTGRELAIVSPVSGTTRDRIEAAVLRDGIAYVLTDTAGLTDTPGDAIEAIGIDRAHAAMAGADIVLWLGDSEPQARSHIAVHARADIPLRPAPSYPHIAVSAKTGQGLAALWEAIHARATQLVPAEDVVAVNVRQHELVARAGTCLFDCADHADPLIIAENLRTALRVLYSISGRGDVDGVLDQIFAKFCIGK